MPATTSASQHETDTASWYAEKVARHGYDHRGLGFRTRSSQEKRFEALLGLGEFHGRTILDVGCGFGDFLAFLQSRGIFPLYAGIDLCAPMIARCRSRFDGAAARFEVADVLEYEPSEMPHYVVASGIFGLDAPGARERIRPTIARMFGWAREGLALNFLSGRSDDPAEGRVYVEPAEALEIAFSLTPAVRLDHGYLPNDFTLHLDKTPAWRRGSGDSQASPSHETSL